MPTPEGDKEVFRVAHSFIMDALACAKAEELDSAQARNAALEDSAAITSEGHLYELFLGASDRVPTPQKPSMGDDYGYFDYK